MKLNLWSLNSNSDPWLAPELRTSHISGIVEGNPNFDDGDNITTSAVKSITMVDGQAVAETKSGSKYILGDVDPQYEAMFPGALQRLIAKYDESKIEE